MHFTEITPEEYQQFVLNYPNNTFLQSVNALQLHRQRFNPVYLVGVKKQETLVAAAALVQLRILGSRHYLYAQRGYLLAYRDFALLRFFHQNVLAFAKAQGAWFIKIDPYLPYCERDSNLNPLPNSPVQTQLLHALSDLGFEHQGFPRQVSSSSQARWMFVLNLQGQTPSSLLAGMQPLARRCIQNALQLPIRIKALTLEELPLFYQIVQHTRQAQRLDGRSLAYYQQLYKNFGANAKALLVQLDLPAHIYSLQKQIAKQENILYELSRCNPGQLEPHLQREQLNQQLQALQGMHRQALALLRTHAAYIPLCAGFYIAFGNEMVYLAGGCYEEFSSFYGPYAMHWHMLNQAIGQGCLQYNFYGISPHLPPQPSNCGAWDFLQGFGGRVVELAGDFIYPVCPLRTQLYQWGKWLKNKKRPAGLTGKA